MAGNSPSGDPPRIVREWTVEQKDGGIATYARLRRPLPNPGAHGAGDLSSEGYCCGDSYLICEGCGHRGMEHIGMQDAILDIIECPACKREIQITTMCQKGQVV